MERFEVTSTKDTIEVKRLNLPLVLKCKCPKCKTIVEYDLMEAYLMYPKVNAEETVGVYCDHCDDHFDQKIILKIAIEVL